MSSSCLRPPLLLVVVPEVSDRCQLAVQLGLQPIQGFEDDSQQLLIALNESLTSICAHCKDHFRRRGLPSHGTGKNLTSSKWNRIHLYWGNRSSMWAIASHASNVPRFLRTSRTPSGGIGRIGRTHRTGCHSVVRWWILLYHPAVRIPPAHSVKPVPKEVLSGRP